MQRRIRRRRESYIKWLALGISGAVLIVAVIVLILTITREESKEPGPEDFLISYMNQIERQDYETMYAMLEPQSAAQIGQEAFVARNANIYEGIEIRNLVIDNIEAREHENRWVTLTYDVAFDTLAGPVTFGNDAILAWTGEGYQLVWDDGMIYPELQATDKVRVSTTQAERGRILDRNGTLLAGPGEASSVGIVPGKFDAAASTQQVAELLGMDAESITKSLSASWVKEDSFVPLKTLPKVQAADLLTDAPDEGMLYEQQRQEQLLTIPGIMISTTQVRVYPLKEAASHLIGYIQNVTEEDLDEHKGEGYTANSVIGRSGIEGLCEARLKGQDGCEISIVDESGQKTKVLASAPKKDGADIRLTIDASLQTTLYEQFREDKGCSVAMHPYTGEVLALVSTPSYDDNEFILGMSQEKWNLLNEDERQPLFNRFRQTFSPGSSLKPVIAAIGLAAGTLNPLEDFGNVGLSWQKDGSWGSYMVTTLHAYEPVILENALIYSDNIYFARAALDLGAEQLENGLLGLGFGQEVPFEIVMKASQISNTGKIETEIQLADSGYGQGEILVNPLHLASLYTAFSNQGNVLKPYLMLEEGTPGEIWLEEAFSPETADTVLAGLKMVISDPNGSGYGAYREDTALAGKTGTAEIKVNKEDAAGTELGWFAVFTTDKNEEKPVLIISMVEDVKERGGSGYVVEKEKAVLEAYLQ